MSSYDDRDTAITRDAGYGQDSGYGQQGGTVAPPQQQQQHQYGYQQPYGQPYGAPYYGGYGMYGRRGFGRGMGGMHGMGGSNFSETKPFFMTSEFLGTLLCIAGVCITAASARFLDAHGAALMSTILVAAYTVSRGIAKAGTRSSAWDPRDEIRPGSHDGEH
jgi:hypothetical protein